MLAVPPSMCPSPSACPSSWPRIALRIEVFGAPEKRANRSQITPEAIERSPLQNVRARPTVLELP